ncbi:MAG: hypothetical protein Q9191_005837 [Dirinaria sp. TL-2023a]
MSRPSTPHVKIPEVGDRKQIQPGPNSWAQASQKPSVMKIKNPGPATNRDKYENKPMPPLPRTLQPSSASHTPGKPGYIQPATPLTYTNQPMVKTRAVTDPVALKPIFGGSKTSIGELRRKFSGTKDNAHINSAEAVARPRTPVPSRSELPTQSPKCHDLLSVRHDQPPASAQLATTAPGLFQSADHQGRQQKSTPSLRDGYEPDDQVPNAKTTRSSADRSDHNNALKMNDLDGIIMGDGKLNPTRKGTYGTVGEVQYVEGKAVHRVASSAGIIENAEYLSESDDRSEQSSAHAASSSADTGHPQGRTDFLQPRFYSPNNYGGVWENDPQVVSIKPAGTWDKRLTVQQGHTLPPFSPMPPRFPLNAELHHKNSSEGSHVTVPLNLNNEPFGQRSRFPAYQPSIISTNSWAPPRQDHVDPPLSATVPPLFSNPHNHVPPPPQTHGDYQPPTGPLPVELARLELTLHHHIDSCFGSLTRLVNGKHDQTADRLLTRLEDQERKIEKALKNLKCEIQDIKQHIETVKVDSQALQKTSEGLHDSLKDMTASTGAVDGKLSQILSKLNAMDQSLTDVNARFRETGLVCEGCAGKTRRQSATSEYPQQREGVSPIRSQSTYPSPALPSQRQQYQSGASRSSGGGRQGSVNSRGRRPTTANGAVGSQSGDDRSARRVYYAEIGANMGEAPDLRQHPAFALQQQQQNYGCDANGLVSAVGSDDTPYQVQSLSGYGPNGWYQQAYGQH